jgi:RimJ/RimL family protein N-acetyltransferase
VEKNIEHLRPWMPWVAYEPLDIATRVQLIETWERDWAAGGEVIYGVVAAGHVLGGCGLHRRRGPNGLEIGYWVDRDHLRQGVGTEVARLLTTAALAVPGVTFVEIHHDKANVASSRIPARLGYAFVGEAPDEVSAPGELGIDCAWRMRDSDWDAPGGGSAHLATDRGTRPRRWVRRGDRRRRQPRDP